MPLPASLTNKLELPVIGSPLFIISTPKLVIAQCKAGIVGSFPALNARPKERLEEWIVEIKHELAPTRPPIPARRSRPSRSIRSSTVPTTG
jgi:nitronate monooxygenase